MEIQYLWCTQPFNIQKVSLYPHRLRVDDVVMSENTQPKAFRTLSNLTDVTVILGECNRNTEQLYFLNTRVKDTSTQYRQNTGQLLSPVCDDVTACE